MIALLFLAWAAISGVLTLWIIGVLALNTEHDEQFERRNHE